MSSISLTLGLRGRLLSGTQVTLQGTLFGNNEPGFTFEPWDITTLYQDRAGTTPVTAAGQSVGLRLDKSKGLALGPELRTATVVVSGAWTQAGGVVTAPGTNGAIDNVSYTLSAATVAGRFYEVAIPNTMPSGSFYVDFGSGTGSQVGALGSSTQRIILTCTASGSVIRVGRWTGSPTGTIGPISVREIAGNHQVAVSDAKRGVYGWMPKTGRRNQLTYTEDLSNAVWGKTRITTSGTKFAADSTADTSHSIQYNGLTYSGIASTVSFDASADEISLLFVQMGSSAIAGFNLATGALTSYSLGSPTATIVSLGSGLYRCTMTATPNSNSLIFFLGEGSGSTLDVTLAGVRTGQGLNINRLQVDAGAATAYQRVVSQYDITEAGVPTCYYVQADGVDDAYVTPTITPNTDKVQVFAGVRKLGASGTVGILAEMGNFGNGTFSFHVPLTGTTDFTSRGTSVASAALSGYSAPSTEILTGLGDIAGDRATLRINGAQVAQVTTDQGTGNYLAYPAYIYARGGTTFPFNGLDFGHAVRFGPNLDAATIARVESLIARNTPEVTL